MVKLAANATLFPGTSVTSDASPVVLNLGDNQDGYYLILASNGKNAAVQTIGNVTIKEKNDYPSLDKEQQKKDGTWTDKIALPKELWSYIDYFVSVDIPSDANKPMAIIDTMVKGLDYDSTTGLTVYITEEKYTGSNDSILTDSAKYTGYLTPTYPTGTDSHYYDANATWQILIPAEDVEDNQGKFVTVLYRAQVNDETLEINERDNTAKLVYDEGHYVLVKKINYTTYYGGIKKVDGSDTEVPLDGIKFVVTRTTGSGDDAVTEDFPVKKVTDDDGVVLYYVPDPEGDSNEVVTGENGLIIIRGLDNEYTYTLTETETQEGYNLADVPVDLILHEDVKVKVGEDDDADWEYKTQTYQQVENNKGVQLPSTGGIGTTLFYVLGTVLVLGAGVVLVSKRRVRE